MDTHDGPSAKRYERFWTFSLTKSLTLLRRYLSTLSLSLSLSLSLFPYLFTRTVRSMRKVSHLAMDRSCSQTGHKLSPTTFSLSLSLSRSHPHVPRIIYRSSKSHSRSTDVGRGGGEFLFWASSLVLLCPALANVPPLVFSSLLCPVCSLLIPPSSSLVRQVLPSTIK